MNYLPNFNDGCGACPFDMACGWLCVCVNPGCCQGATMRMIMNIMVTDPGLRHWGAWPEYCRTGLKRTERKYRKCPTVLKTR